MKNNKQRLFEIMGKLDNTFKPRLNENYETDNIDIDDSSVLNEGLMDFFNKYKNKIKDFAKNQLNKLSSDKLEKLKEEIKPYQGKSLEEIKAMVIPKLKGVKINESYSINENFGEKAADIIGKAFGGTLVLSSVLSMILMGLEKVGVNWLDTQFGFYTVLVAGVSWVLFIVVGLLGSADTVPNSNDGVDDATKHSSAYISNQMRQADRNAGY